MKKVELLAPAGDENCVYAAVNCGADAVYIGASKFSARAYAANFNEENIEKIIDYCHMYGVKVYVTVNTLIKENEIEEALKYVKFLYEIGTDALIIQDAGLTNIILNKFPDFEIHASTQMTVHNAHGALMLKNCGFKRIVLAREMAINEVNHISKDLNIETEIFIHGALCVCYSGQCLMSSMIGGRSGNRGRCAQPCRMPYTLADSVHHQYKNGYLLSMKDICTICDIKKIIESGAASLKIEGRMKKPEYVAGVVESYRKAIDCVYSGNTLDFESERKKLLKLFNREGFSKSYFFGNMGKEMMAYNFPKNTGILVGKVQKNGSVKLVERLSVKDGIRNGTTGFTVSKILRNNIEVESAKAGEVVLIKPDKYKDGDELYKTLDVELQRELKSKFKNIYSRKISVPLSVVFKVGKPLKLRAKYMGKDFLVDGPIVEKALKCPLSREKMSKNFEKSMDTPIQFDNITYDFFDEGFLPVSSINNTRRELAGNIEMFAKKSYKRYYNNNIEFKEDVSVLHKDESNIPDVMIYAYTEEQIRAAYDCNFKNVAVNIFNREMDIDNLKKFGNLNIYLKVPNIIKEEFDEICSMIDSNISHVKGIVTSNLGIIEKYKGKAKIIGDYKLNIFNSFANEFYRKFIDAGCISVELNRREIEDTIKNSVLPCQVLIYGKIELMVSEYCPIGSIIGNNCGKKNCKCACMENDFYLKDRMNAEFRIITDKYCRSHIYNCVPINLISEMNEIKNMGNVKFRVDFIDEDYSTAVKILKSVSLRKFTGKFDGFTHGHYRRGVE